MTVSTFKYADQDFLSGIYPDYANLIPRNRLLTWRTLATDVYAAERVGFGTALFYNGKDLASYKLSTTTASVDTTLAAGITTADTTSITVSATTNTQPGTIIQVDDEQMFVVAQVSLNLTVIRGFFGTSRTTHTNGTNVELIGLDFNSQYEWYYDTTDDILIMFSSTSPESVVMEIGQDKDTYVNQALVNASMELNNSLDARFRGVVPKTFQYSNAPSTDTPEYDYIIRKMTALLALADMSTASERNELYSMFYDKVLNDDKDGLLDRLNSGDIKLTSEISQGDKNGKPITITKTGTMELVEITGQYNSTDYERFQILCTTGGACGTAIVTIKTSSATALFGVSQTGEVVTGRLQSIGSNIKVRFEGASMTADDRWDVEFWGQSIKQNSNYGSIKLCQSRIPM